MVAFEPTTVLEHEAVIGGFKYLTKREQAHHTNFPELLDLAEFGTISQSSR